MFVVKENDHIRMVVINGQRPDLSVMSGPETLVKLAVDWISRCWHQSPDERPTFAGICCISFHFIGEIWFRNFLALTYGFQEQSVYMLLCTAVHSCCCFVSACKLIFTFLELNEEFTRIWHITDRKCK